VDLAIVGLGRMGGNMVRRLHLGGHRVVAYNRTPAKTREIVAEGIEGAFTPEEVCTKLEPPRVVWIMVPAGAATEQTIAEFLPHLSPGDTIVDGGNANFHDSKRRHTELKAKGIRFVDAGISGGIWGLKNGYGTMVGGDREDVEPLEPIFSALAPPGGYIHCGPAGSGHYVKMVHNGIEYGMLQAYAEGFELLHASDFRLDLREIAHLWNQGSVVRSWLCELAERAFEAEGSELHGIRGYVEDSGEGRWTVLDALDKDVPAPVITLSLMARFGSRQPESYAAKMIAALRNQFGGHAVQASGGGLELAADTPRGPAGEPEI
jgi:6-phosphogluconate dehydrogenase